MSDAHRAVEGWAVEGWADEGWADEGRANEDRPREGWPRGRAVDGGVDEIPLPHGPGRLWMCGKHAVGPDPGALLERVGASTLVCLCQPHELLPRYPEYVSWLETHRPHRAVWFPIPDLHAPPVEAARHLLGELTKRLAAGEGLVVHCGAGIGRAGTVAAGVLITMGVDAGHALRTVAAHRPMAGPEVGAQQELINALAGPVR